MKVLMVAALFGMAGCAPTVFHDGRTTLARREQPCLASRKGAPSGIFARSCQVQQMRSWNLLRWDASRSFAVSNAPVDLLETIRDEIGRLNQRPGFGEDLLLAVTVYRFEKAGLWNGPVADYELVARDMLGRVVWAVDDKIEAREDLAQALTDPPSAVIAREILRKLRRQFSL
jgi:hypothetical protein